MWVCFYRHQLDDKRMTLLECLWWAVIQCPMHACALGGCQHCWHTVAFCDIPCTRREPPPRRRFLLKPCDLHRSAMTFCRIVNEAHFQASYCVTACFWYSSIRPPPPDEDLSLLSSISEGSGMTTPRGLLTLVDLLCLILIPS